MKKLYLLLLTLALVNSIAKAQCSFVLLSAPGSDVQVKCVNTSIDSIVYATTGATGADFDNLPAGVSGTWRNDSAIITGLATSAGTFAYMITLSGTACANEITSGVITINPAPIINLTSATGTDAQSVCTNSPITDITYNIADVNTVSVIDLPQGVGYTFLAGVLTINGTPTLPNVYTYTVLAQGACGNTSITGMITVASHTITLTPASGSPTQNAFVNTPITPIVYATTGATATGISITGLPQGVNYSFVADSITISGVPTAQGVFAYTLTSTGNCVITTSGTITVTAGSIQLTSGDTLQSVCVNTPINNITFLTTCATGATFSGLPTGISGFWVAGNITIIGTPSTAGVYRFTVTPTGVCNTPAQTGVITVNPANTIILSSPVTSDVQTVCVNQLINRIVYKTTGATGAQVTGLPIGVNATWMVDSIVISGTPSSSFGNFQYTMTLTGGCGFATASGSIKVNLVNTISLSSAPGTNAQSVCAGTPITTITYATGSATGAVVTGLPPGVAYQWNLNVLTISGSPTIAGDSVYRITLTGGCGLVKDSGIIKVTTGNSISLSLGNPQQSPCLNGSIADIVYRTSGATGANVTGLPAGVSGNWAANVFTISGSPTALGTYNYTVRLTGGCGIITTTGTITVVSSNTITLATAGTNVQTICKGSTITPILYNTTGASNASFNNLPAGLSGSWSSNVATITGTPTQAGTFNYTVQLAGGCGNLTASGTIVVNPVPVAAPNPASQTICSGSDIVPIAFNGNTQDTLYTWIRNNSSSVAGIGANGAGDISGTLTNMTSLPITVSFSITPRYTNATLTCTGATTTANVVVNPMPNVSASPLNQATCSGAGISPIHLSGAVAGTSFNWVRNNASVGGIPANGLGDITGILTNTINVPAVVDFSITPVYTNAGKTCSGVPISAVVRVNPVPDAIANIPAQAICSGSSIVPVSFTSSVNGTVFSWTRNNTLNVTGISDTGAGTIGGILTNSTNVSQTVRFVITPGFISGNDTCKGASFNYDVIVHPIPDAQASISANTLCSSIDNITINITGSVALTSFTWARDNTVIAPGIGANGLGNISGTITNTTASAVPVTFTIIPRYETCQGLPVLATVVVNPVPTVVAPQITPVICSGSVVPQMFFPGAVAGAVYNWTRDNTATFTGIAAGGTGNVNGVLTNTTSQPGIVNFTVVPSYTNGGRTCSGPGISSSVVVNPTPVTNAINNISVCNGADVPDIKFSSNSPDSSFTWKAIPGIGFGTSGSGSIPAFKAINTGNRPVISTVTVSVSAKGCKGPDTTFTITVRPSPSRPSFTSLSSYADKDTVNVCLGSNNLNFNISQVADGVSYKWSAVPATPFIRDVNDPNTVISFNTTGTYAIRVAASIDSSGCRDTVTQIVRVNATPGIDERKIVLKQPGNLLIYPDNSLNALSGYQWGYDSLVRSAPDTAFSFPITLPGQLYQYLVPDKRFIKNNQLDTVNYTYWVLLKQGNCQSRVYYNGPYASGRIRPADAELSTIELKVYPNPASGVFYISLRGNIYGNITAHIYNALGQPVYSSRFVKSTTSVSEKINAAHLPAGIYHLVVLGSDLNKASTRFIIQHQPR